MFTGVLHLKNIAGNRKTFVLSGLLFACIIFLYLIGVRAGSYQKRNNPVPKQKVWLHWDVLCLVYWHYCFTFNISASRYYIRQALLILEANNISTAFSCADLYPTGSRREFRKIFSDMSKQEFIIIIRELMK